MVSASSSMGYLSLATMLVQTNDGIVLANSLPLFDEDGNARSFTMDLISYDAGTEDNNELATHVPGPPFDGMVNAHRLKEALLRRTPVSLVLLM